MSKPCRQDEDGNVYLYAKKRTYVRRPKAYSWAQKMALLDCYEKLIARGNDPLYALKHLKIRDKDITKWQAERVQVAQQEAIREAHRCS